MRSRYLGTLLGLACGDAVGTSVEFKPRGSFPLVEDMAGGGPFHLEAGQWTDDTSMALCLAESLIESRRFDPDDQMKRYIRWYRDGHLSSTGRCFDIGTTVRRALLEYENRSARDPAPYEGKAWCGSPDPNTAGNGSLVRLAPIPLYFANQPARAIEYAALSSRTTACHPERQRRILTQPCALHRLALEAIGAAGRRPSVRNRGGAISLTKNER